MFVTRSLRFRFPLLTLETTMSGKGRKRLLEAFEASSSKHSRLEKDPPLSGTLVCLTGLTSDRKNHYHSIVEALGGRYSRDFNVDKNTHLIAETAGGAKYQLAASNPQIYIVTPAWLEACHESNSRVQETKFLIEGPKGGEELANQSSLQLSTKKLLLDSGARNTLFQFKQFLLLGFEEDSAFKRDLGKLIRRGRGTIHWDLTSDVNMIIVHDTCPESLRKASQVIMNHHPNLPSVVSPRWVIESCRSLSLEATENYPPMRLAKGLGSVSKAKRKSTSLSNTSQQIFGGMLFGLARLAPPSWAVDFASQDQESIIRENGGHILTMQLMEAMRTDAEAGGKRRKCFVVCWGGGPQFELNPILSQLERGDVCDLVLVTPIWLMTCISLRKVVLPEQCPGAMAPVSWPFRLLSKELRVSLTGFQGTEKIALVHLLRVCGVTFDKDMTASTTHLIAREGATGLKIEKAREWKIHLVTIDWLFHVLEYGHKGKEQKKNGCELNFEWAENVGMV